MSSSRKRSGRRRGGQKPKPTDLWRPVPQLPDPTPIRPVSDPTALIRSLGDPPLPGQAAVAQHYLSAVLERSAVLASALAASAGLLADEDPADT
ncbi:MAG TPA: hypothetical protein VIR58_17930 [Acidimicrobiales bacterium]